MVRGSYNSALNVFEKSVELNPSNYYAKLQIAKVKYILQQYQESIADYEELLSIIPDYLPALKGIAESHAGQGCDRGGVFDLVELWVDNRTLVEVLPPEGTARYLAFYNPAVAAQMFMGPPPGAA